MVERVLAKDGVGVRFPLPAPKQIYSPRKEAFAFIWSKTSGSILPILSIQLSRMFLIKLQLSPNLYWSFFKFEQALQKVL